MSTNGTDTRNESARGGRRKAGWVALVTAGALMASSLWAVAPAGAAAKPATGTLTVEAPGVTVLKKGADSFAKGKPDQKIAVGDTVQTDATGLAQITFKDGTLTRLDHNTVFTLDELSNKTGARAVEGTVSAGQTWNRVQKLSESETFEQKGNGATAAVARNLVPHQVHASGRHRLHCRKDEEGPEEAAEVAAAVSSPSSTGSSRSRRSARPSA